MSQDFPEVLPIVAMQSVKTSHIREGTTIGEGSLTHIKDKYAVRVREAIYSVAAEIPTALTIVGRAVRILLCNRSQLFSHRYKALI